MRSKRTIRRGTQASRTRASQHIDPSRVPADVPLCVTCGQPLARLPRFLHSARGAAHGFQCQRCFYANTAGRAPREGDVIGTDRTRWLTEATRESSEPPSRRDEDD